MTEIQPQLEILQNKDETDFNIHSGQNLIAAVLLEKQIAQLNPRSDISEQAVQLRKTVQESSWQKYFRFLEHPEIDVTTRRWEYIIRSHYALQSLADYPEDWKKQWSQFDPEATNEGVIEARDLALKAAQPEAHRALFELSWFVNNELFRQSNPANANLQYDPYFYSVFQDFLLGLEIDMDIYEPYYNSVAIQYLTYARVLNENPQLFHPAVSSLLLGCQCKTTGEAFIHLTRQLNPSAQITITDLIAPPLVELKKTVTGDSKVHILEQEDATLLTHIPDQSQDLIVTNYLLGDSGIKYDVAQNFRRIMQQVQRVLKDTGVAIMLEKPAFEGMATLPEFLPQFKAAVTDIVDSLGFKVEFRTIELTPALYHGYPNLNDLPQSRAQKKNSVAMVITKSG